MDTQNIVLFGVIILLAANYSLRLEAVRRQRWLVWLVTLADVSVGTMVLLNGMPGFGSAPAVSWILGLMCMLHVAENLRAINAERSVRKRKQPSSAETHQLLEALRAGGDDAAAEQLEREQAERKARR